MTEAVAKPPNKEPVINPGISRSLLCLEIGFDAPFPLKLLHCLVSGMKVRVKIGDCLAEFGRINVDISRRLGRIRRAILLKMSLPSVEEQVDFVMVFSR
jgi:hypothetical protein